MPKISVIIPVYNAEKYLRECLDSITNQTFKDIEIICVNDGSTDSSLQILNEYAQKDNRIIVISQDNQGLSAARNTGIANATGEYISFVDSDDYVSENLYENLVKYLPQELICFESQLYPQDLKNPINKNLVNKYNGLVNVDDKIIKNTNVYAWNKLFKTSIIKENNIQFPKGLTFEDFPFIWEYMLCIKKAYYLNKKLYFYRQHNNSIMKNCNTKSIHHLYVWHYLYDRLMQKNLLDKHKQTIKDLFGKYVILAYKFSDDSQKDLIIKTANQYASEIGYKKISKLINTLKNGDIIYSNNYERIFSIKNIKKLSTKYKVLTLLNQKIVIKKTVDKPKVLLHLHLYYTDQLKFMIKKMKNINSCNWDLYVTLVEENQKIINQIKEFKPDAKIIIVENRGYDVWPFLQVLNHVNLDDYDFILKFHTKNYRNIKDFYGKGFSWRNFLIDALLKNKKIFANNLKIITENPDIGIIGSKVTLAQMGAKEIDDTTLFEK